MGGTGLWKLLSIEEDDSAKLSMMTLMELRARKATPLNRDPASVGLIHGVDMSIVMNKCVKTNAACVYYPDCNDERCVGVQ